VTLDSDRTLRPVFGTTLTRVVNGSGRIEVHPDQPAYARGAQVRLAAVPASGQFFARWSGACQTTNPLASLTVTGPTPSLVASFSPVPAGSAVLTVIPRGWGSVTVNPLAAYYRLGDVVTLTAQPDEGHSFIKWTGSLNSLSPALSLVMDRDLELCAQFTGAGFSSLEELRLLASGEVVFRLLSDPGAVCDLLVCTNLSEGWTWSVSATLTNQTGSGWITNDSASEVPARLYRVRQTATP
jgi:hypothetical protein